MKTKQEHELNSLEKDLLARWRNSCATRNELEKYQLSLKWYQFKEEKKVMESLNKVYTENSLLMSLLHKHHIL